MVQSTSTQYQLFPSSRPGQQSTLSFAQFNPALGTLRDIKLTIIVTVDAAFGVENLGTGAASVNFNLSGSFDLTTD